MSMREVEKITEIKEVNHIRSVEHGFGSYDGYMVKTTKHSYHILISNFQACCEDWGYMTSEDEIEKFIGSELRKVRLTDTALSTTVFDETIKCLDCGGIQLVDFMTNRGNFQIAVYNGHNGYYGHSIVVLKDDEAILKDVL